MALTVYTFNDFSNSRFTKVKVVMTKIPTPARHVKGRHATPRPLVRDDLSVKYSWRRVCLQLRMRNVAVWCGKKT
jgi:hypothetical protein